MTEDNQKPNITREVVMSENPSNEESIVDEFHALSQNLLNTMRAAWDSPERKSIQTEIEEGLQDLSSTIKNEVDSFNQSQTGQRLKSDVEDFREQIRKGETESKVREEIINALRIVNSELEKVATHWSSTEDDTKVEDPPNSEDG
jgi:hypothetical protein